MARVYPGVYLPIIDLPPIHRRSREVLTSQQTDYTLVESQDWMPLPLDPIVPTDLYPSHIRATLEAIVRPSRGHGGIDIGVFCNGELVRCERMSHMAMYYEYNPRIIIDTDIPRDPNRVDCCITAMARITEPGYFQNVNVVSRMEVTVFYSEQADPRNFIVREFPNKVQGKYVEPENNDGRDTCFFCDEELSIIDGFKVCKECD